MVAVPRKEEEFKLYIRKQWQDTEDQNKRLHDDSGSLFLAPATHWNVNLTARDSTAEAGIQESLNTLFSWMKNKRQSILTACLKSSFVMYMKRLTPKKV